MVERVEALKHMGQMPEDPQSFIADPTGRAAWMKPEEIDKLIEDGVIPDQVYSEKLDKDGLPTGRPDRRAAG